MLIGAEKAGDLMVGRAREHGCPLAAYLSSCAASIKEKAGILIRGDLAFAAILCRG